MSLPSLPMHTTGASDFSDRFCVIGAGPCGLTAAKNLLEQGIPCDVLEREADLGGNWNIANRESSVYASTHLISSKTLTAFTDFPMPESYPHYPSHAQVLAYLRQYAEHFGVTEHIQFNSHLERAEPDGNSWRVQVRGEAKPRKYAGLIVANGHHSEPLWPHYDGSFQGATMHAHAYKSPEVLRGRRVLVVGAGNSGCDIAAEAANHAAATFLSFRRGYHFLPKFVRGLPIDLRGEGLHRWGFPLWLRRWLGALTIRLHTGLPEMYGLPRPDHRLFETHPIVNSQLLYELGHGKLGVKPDISQFRGDCVQFVDGSEERIDLVIFATGYKVSIPFLDSTLLFSPAGQLNLYLHAFHPEHDNFFVAGLIQPDSGIWGLADLQCCIAARYVRGLREDPAAVRWFTTLKQRGPVDLGSGVRYVNSPRHQLEVEYFGYRRKLQQLVRRFR